MNKQFTSFINHLTVACVCLLAGLSVANAEVEKSTLWREAVITELDVDFGGTGFHARWRHQRCECGDLYLEVEQVAPDGVLTGELLMVDGQVLLARGFEGQGADIEPLIQAPSLMLQLAYSMLVRSQPKGPYAVREKQVWDEKEETIDFHLNTGLATGVFAAPWKVKGTGWTTDEGHRRFEMVFQFTNSLDGQETTTDSITFSGKLDFNRQDFPYVESTSLDGWKIQWLSLNERESKLLDDGLTLKELRKQASDS